MHNISSEEAVARARAKTNTSAAIPARAWVVRRLDRPGDSYYLVVLGNDSAVVGLAAVGAASGEVETWANLPGLNPHQIIEQNEAIERAGALDEARAELVWKPCRPTHSPLYPLWEIQTAGKTVYVDQQGKVWPSLIPGGPGG